MRYILIQFDDGVQAFQEISAGRVVRFTDLFGQTVSDIGRGSIVIDANPEQPAWALPDPEDAPAPAPEPSRLLTKNQFIDRLGGAAFVTILAMAKASVEVEAWLFRFTNATPDANGNSVDLDDPRTVAGINALEPALIAQGVVTEGWAAGVLNA